MANNILTTYYHSGIIGFVEGTQLNEIKKFAKRLSNIKSFVQILIRRVSEKNWGIGIIFKCNSICKKKRDINDEIKYLLAQTKDEINVKKINYYDISGSVIPVKPPHY